MRRSLAAPLLVGLFLRLLAVAASDRVVADVKRYERVSRHLLDVSPNPYETRRLYPYPPPWAAVEAGAGWLSRRGLVSFPVAVKLPVLAADLLIVVALSLAARRRRAAAGAAWLYALHPVAILVGGFHGQFDAIPLLFVLVAVEALADGRRDASALALGGAIAVKSFPVLMLPFLATADAASPRRALRYAVLAAAPVAVLVLPFAIADPSALVRELFAYSGVADFGWAGVWRGVSWLATGGLARAEALFWPAASTWSKLLFLAGWAGLLLAARAGRLQLAPERWCLAVVLVFLTLYGLLSAQYLLWAVPLGLLRPDRPAASYALTATAGLVGFYLSMAPGVLLPRPLEPPALERAEWLWVAGAAATLPASAFWLLRTLRAGRVGLRAATEAT